MRKQRKQISNMTWPNGANTHESSHARTLLSSLPTEDWHNWLRWSPCEVPMNSIERFLYHNICSFFRSTSVERPLHTEEELELAANASLDDAPNPGKHVPQRGHMWLGTSKTSMKLSESMWLHATRSAYNRWPQWSVRDLMFFSSLSVSANSGQMPARATVCRVSPLPC